MMTVWLIAESFRWALNEGLSGGVGAWLGGDDLSS